MVVLPVVIFPIFHLGCRSCHLSSWNSLVFLTYVSYPSSEETALCSLFVVLCAIKLFLATLLNLMNSFSSDGAHQLKSGLPILLMLVITIGYYQIYFNTWLKYILIFNTLSNVHSLLHNWSLSQPSTHSTQQASQCRLEGTASHSLYSWLGYQFPRGLYIMQSTTRLNTFYLTYSCPYGISIYHIYMYYC